MSCTWGGHPLSGVCRGPEKMKRIKDDKRDKEDKKDKSAVAVIKDKRSPPRAAQAGNPYETLWKQTSSG